MRYFLPHYTEFLGTNIMAKKNFKKKDKFIIFADVPPIASDDRLQKYVEAGFTYYNHTEDYVVRDKENGGITDEYYSYIDAAHKAGLKVLLRTMRRNSADYYDGITDEFKGKVEGFYIADEPSFYYVDWYGSTTIEKLKKQVAWYNKYGGDSLFHVNLLQDYGMRLVHKEPPKYEEYLDTYIETVLKNVNGEKSLSTDHYPIAFDENGNHIKESAIKDYYLIADRSKMLKEHGHDIRTCFCIQLVSDKGLHLRTPNCLEDIIFQTNFAIAFGAKMLEYYKYAGNAEAIIMDKQNQTTYSPAYDWVKLANERVHLLGKYVLSYDWNQTKTYLGSDYTDEHNERAFKNVEVFQPESFKALKNFKSSADAIVSEFVKENGVAYMAVNYTEPTAGINNIVEFEFDDVESVNIVKEGKKIDAEIKDGKINVSLSAGEAVFIEINA